MPNPKEIRQIIRARRRLLRKQECEKNSAAAAAHFIRHIALIRCRRIALYLAADGELDPRPLADRLCQLNKKLYLPVLRPSHHKALWFSEFHQDDRLQPNRFGIAEPDIRHRKPIPAWGLDLIILPLVAFSNEGTRIGMGGGYYDRTLAYQLIHQQWNRPTLIGYAHEFQRLEALPRRRWDVPLHGVITECGYQQFK
ncbi:5-formyltetrahydrofolate cyclo-ligase [Sedimenticola hydrogenitrophicus]|uniref:5-formyltetrahydrofolate cyclo-ligase n=1 Tax=Sedimenticola hydrogenitrophicus TaxID=2967975 RepID=UPI003B58AE89